MNSITSAVRAASLIHLIDKMAIQEGICLEVRTDIENYGAVRESQPGRGAFEYQLMFWGMTKMC